MGVEAPVPLYYFNLHEDGEIVVDDEGKELPGLWQAMEWAAGAAREIMSADVALGHLDLACCVVIEDEARVEALRIEFADVLRVTSRHAAPPRSGG